MEITITNRPVDMKRIYQGGDDDLDAGVTVRPAPALSQAPDFKSGGIKSISPAEAKWITRRDIRIDLAKKPKRDTVSYRLWVTVFNNTKEEDSQVLDFIREALGYGHIGNIGERKILLIPEGYNAVFLRMVSKYVNRKDVNDGLKYLAQEQKEFELNSMEQRLFEEVFKDLLVEEK